jgi:hypothetical protein
VGEEPVARHPEAIGLVSNNFRADYCRVPTSAGQILAPAPLAALISDACIWLPEMVQVVFLLSRRYAIFDICLVVFSITHLQTFQLKVF